MVIAASLVTVWASKIYKVRANRQPGHQAYWLVTTSHGGWSDHESSTAKAIHGARSR